MELVMFGDEDDDADIEDAGEDDELAIEWARRNSSLDPSPIEPPPTSSTFPLMTPRAPEKSLLPLFTTPYDSTMTPMTTPTTTDESQDTPSERPRPVRRPSHPQIGRAHV